MSTPEPGSIRIGTAEREAAVKALGDHFAQGRLEPHEFEERMAAAYASRTAADLDRLFDDLPRGDDTPYPARRALPGTGADTRHLPANGQAGSPHPVPHGGYDPAAPYGREPVTGQPYSDRSKVIAGLLQLLLPMGIGRLYSGQTGIGVAQLLLAPFMIGMIWAFIDGIVILAGRPTDGRGRPLRP